MTGRNAQASPQRSHPRAQMHRDGPECKLAPPRDPWHRASRDFTPRKPRPTIDVYRVEWWSPQREAFTNPGSKPLAIGLPYRCLAGIFRTMVPGRSLMLASRSFFASTSFEMFLSNSSNSSWPSIVLGLRHNRSANALTSDVLANHCEVGGHVLKHVSRGLLSQPMNDVCCHSCEQALPQHS